MAGGASADEGVGFDFFSLLDSASSDDLSVVIAIGNTYKQFYIFHSEIICLVIFPPFIAPLPI